MVIRPSQSWPQTLLRTRRFYRGFTMTELAIVLGIIGLILGAIWIAGGKVGTNRIIGRASQETIAIASNIRALFPTGNINQTGDLTSPFITAGVFPPDMVTTSGVKNIVLNPWNGQVLAGSQTGFLGATPSANEFEIEFLGVPTAVCPAFMAAVIGSAMQGGLVWASSTSGGALAVTTTTKLTATQISNCGGTVVFQFTMAD